MGVTIITMGVVITMGVIIAVDVITVSMAVMGRGRCRISRNIPRHRF
jgi:hypothetical protein